MDTLIIQVQVDRLLPTKKNDQKEISWLALKVSSYWKDVIVSTDFHKQAQLPWNWQSQEVENVAWDPSDPKNWTIWRKDSDKYEIIPGKQIDQNIFDENMRTNLEVRLFDKANGKFSDAINDIYSLNSSAHAYPNEEFPKPTVFGFLERLAVSPHPLPLVSRVHGLIAIKTPENSNFSYLAVPKIALIKDGDNIKVDINENTRIVIDEQCHQVDNTANDINFTIKIVGSVPPSDGQPEDEALINLTKQWVKANVPTSKTLLTQDLTAKLPQQLADILDPLNRIRSVLEPLLIKQKQEAGSAKKVAELLCKALNFVAAQVLWPRLDTVGRFECPLIERLSDKGDKILREKHLDQPSDLHKPLPDDKLDAAIRVSVDFYNKNADQTKVLPFDSSSIKSLLQQSESAAHDQSLPSRSDEEILQTLVTYPECLNLTISNSENIRLIHKGELRRFELAQANVGGETNTIVLKVDYIAPGEDSNAQNMDDTDNSPLFDRSDCSLVYAAPFIEGLVSGRDRDGWLDPLIQNTDNNTDKSLRERIAFGMQTLLTGMHDNLDVGNIEPIKQGLYGQLIKAGCEVMGQTTNGENDQAIKLFGKIMTEAAQEAIHLATTLLPYTTNPFDDYITPIPLPLSIEVDQLRTVSRKVDPWTRLSGYGLLIGRGSPEDVFASTNKFYSINAATLHIINNESNTGESAQANEVNAIPWRTDPDGYWKEKSLVDPVPYTPSDHVGISDAIAHYSNSWLCAPMPGDPEKTEGQDNCVRFCYGPPGSSKKLPALCFGYSYQVAAHLISQGGVLAPEIRQEDNPYELKVDNLNSLSDYINTLKYLRTVAISAPTINVPEEADLAGQHNIPLLAEELPRRIPAILLSDEIPYRWNRDSRLGSAEVNVGDSQNDKPVGLRFEGVIKSVISGSKLTVALWHDTAEVASELSINIDSIEDEPQYTNYEKWLIIDIVIIKENAKVFYALVDRPIKNFADSTWKPSSWESPPVNPNSPKWSEGQSPILELKATPINSILFEPVRIRRLEVDKDSPEAERKPLQSPKPQQGAIQGQTLLVNAITQGNKHTKELQGSTIEIQWPSTDRQTWERWVNEALFTEVTDSISLKQKVKDCLTQLQKSLGVKALPDPAVAGIWLELWEIYPAQTIVGKGLFWSVLAGNILTRISNPETIDSRLLQQIQVRINLANSSTQTNPAEGLSSESQEGEQSSSYIINCNPEKIYELRAYPAINHEETTFGAIKNESRLGTAVRELFSPIPANRRDLSNNLTKKLLIGIPSVLRIEIATLPDSEISNWFNKGDDLLKIVYESQERILAQLRFPSQDVNDDVIAKLRRFQSMQLAPQRWMWRGLPLGQRSWMPELMNSWPHSSTNGETERQALFGAAFSGWRDDDLGFLVNAQLKPGHFQRSENQSQTMPLVLEKDLDWRHGWQLWRFRLSLKSRYAALCPEETSIVSLPGSDQWLLREIRDADNGRVPAAPPLALVLPLTEPLQHEGTVPPLLALFHTTMHEEQHFGDGIAVLVDAVHVPFNDDIGLLAQFGPDPIRTGTGHDRSAVALRLDGPIGYSFDNDDTSAAFGYSGYLVTPVSSAIQPWSFIRLSFLRFENPRGLVSAHFSDFRKQFTWYNIQNNRRILEIPSWKCAADQPLTSDPDERKLRYEGLVLQFQLEKQIAKYPSSLEINIGDSKTKIHFSLDTDSNDSLLIECKLITGDKNKAAGKHNLILNKKYTLRLVVSGLPGSSFLLLQLWQESDSSPPFREGTEPLDQNTWLTLFHVPMDPTVTLNNLQIIEDWSNSAQNEPALLSTQNIYPIRLSRATEPVWCQFTAACSVFTVSETSANGEAPNSWSVDKLQAALDPFTPPNNVLLENQKQNLESWKSLRIYPREDEPPYEKTLYIHPSLHNIDANSDLEETILAVFTEWAFTQDLRRDKSLVERPVLADFLIDLKSIDETIDENKKVQSCLQTANKNNTQTNEQNGEQNGEQNLPPPLWSSAFDGTKFLWPITDTPARVRLLRVLLRKNNGSQSNQSSDISSLLELFSQTQTAEPPFSNNPPDAKGMILGISKPFPWHFIEEN